MRALLILFLVLAGCSVNSGDFSPDIQVDFDKSIGTIKMDYGANEDDNWEDFSKSQAIHTLHEHAGSEYIRVWVSNPWHRKSTIPFHDNLYDYESLDRFVNAVLKSGAIPFIVFAHAPADMSMNGYPSNSNPPIDNEMFAEYVANVVSHYKTACENNMMERECDVGDWYFEIWNEPYQDYWWEGEEPLYIKLYRTTYESIKSTSPESKVGGYTLAYFEGNKDRLNRFIEEDMDFVSLHHYANTINEYSGREKKMAMLPRLFYHNLIELDKKLPDDVEIVMSEYNSDYRADKMDVLDEAFTAAWYASAMINEIKSNAVDIELFYSATSNMPDSGFGMWSLKENRLVPWPVYYMKRDFVRYNKQGSQVVHLHNKREDIQALAVKNDMGRYITLVNKRGYETTVNIELEGKKATNVRNEVTYKIINSRLSCTMDGYEMKILKID